MFLVALVLTIPTLLAAMSQAVLPANARFLLLALGLPLLVVTIIVELLWLPASLMVATEAWARGEHPGFGEMLGRSWKASKLMRLLGVWLLIALAFGAIALLAFIVFAGVVMAGAAGADDPLTFFTSPAMAFVGVAALFIFFATSAIFVFLGIRWAMAGPAAVLDETGPLESLRRSVQLLKGRWWDLLLLFIMVVGISAVVYSVVAGPSFVIRFRDFDTTAARFGSGGFTPAGPAGVVAGISAWLAGILLSPLWFSSVTNFYLRARREVQGLSGEAIPGPAPGPDGESYPEQQDESPGYHEWRGDLPEQEHGDDR